MIEQVMFFSLGFLVAALGALAIAPAFWHRAIRLVTRKLELQLPISAREVLAGRDLMRAELAVDKRKLEQKVESLGAQRARDMAELGRRAVAVAGKDAELDALHHRLAARDDENAALRRYLAEASDALDATTTALHDADTRAERGEDEVEELRRHLEALQQLCANQRVAFTALERDLLRERELRTVETVRVARLDDELSDLQQKHDAALARIEAAAAEIASERPRGRAPDRNPADRREEVRAQEASPLATDESFRRDIERLAADLLAYDPDAEALEGTVSGRSPADARAVLRKRISDMGERAVRLAGARRSAGSQFETVHAPVRKGPTEPRG